MQKLMRKCFLLLTLLLLTIITGCVSTKNEITLPPKPERTGIPWPIETVYDLGRIINYYDGLVMQWEAWGDTVERMIYGEIRDNPDNDCTSD